MVTNLTAFLWLMKLGALVNLYFLASTRSATADPHILVPAQIFFAVSAFRCLFPNRYEGNVVFHDSPLSSIFLTRLLATFKSGVSRSAQDFILRKLRTVGTAESVPAFARASLDAVGDGGATLSKAGA